MEALLDALAASGPADWIRRSRWGYAGVATIHVAGIAMLVGAILPMDLRLLGLAKQLNPAGLARLLLPIAACGLLLAATSGGLMFIGRAGEYAGYGVFQIKLALILAGTGSALLAHLRHGIWLDNASPAARVRIGLFSLGCWLGALICGRMIAFVHG